MRYPAELQAVRAFVCVNSNTKVPINPRTNFGDERDHIDAQDPKHWLLPAEAEAYGHGIAYVLQPGDFCLDLDHARDELGQWQPYCQWFLGLFPGAYVEVSQSGEGLHVFGRYTGERPNHGTRLKSHRAELYSRLRYIIMTGSQASGSPLADHTGAFRWLAEHYFPPHDETETPDGLSNAPVDGYTGPADDAALLVGLRRVRTARSVYGGTATFSALYDGDEAVLSRAFPPQTPNKHPWDQSAADQALANWLAWGTGNHGERILRLMWGSALQRAKWNRPDYIVRTINRACASQRAFYTERERPTAPPAGVGPTAPPEGPEDEPPVGDIKGLAEQTECFRGFTFIEDVGLMMTDDGTLLDQKRFDIRFGGTMFDFRADGSAPTRSAWEAFLFNERQRFPRARGVLFDPRQEFNTRIHREGHVYINSWCPVEVKAEPGDATPFLQHLKRILPSGNDADILLAYLAALVQYKGVKFQWWPLIQGVEGNGKTLISKLMQYTIGRRHTHWPRSGQLGARFNSQFYGKVLICCEDVYISEAKGALWESLKPMITGTEFEVEGKGVDTVMREMCFNGIMNTNHQNAIRKTRNDRRIAPFFCAQQQEEDLRRDGMTVDYFNWFRAWCDGAGAPVVAHYLSTYAIPDALNPATTCIRPPDTTATEKAIRASYGVAEQEVIEAIEQCAHGFRGGWVSSSALDKLLQATGRANLVPRNKRRDLMAALGYVPHAAFIEGRLPVLDVDGTRPMVYVLKHSDAARETNPARTVQLYQASQTLALTAPQRVA